MKRLFGTDGLRGEAGSFPLDNGSTRAVGRALAAHVRANKIRAPRFVMGRDTRESGAGIAACVRAGAEEAGAICLDAGVIPTPGVAYLTAAEGADAGIVISASHNPFHDNGIKIFTPSGRKLDDAAEQLIETEVYRARDTASETTEASRESAGGTDDAEAERLRARYVEHLRTSVADGLQLGGLRVVVDCANGAAHELAPRLLRSLGAEVIAINDHPDGRNINRDCGSLHLDGLSASVRREQADLGVAFDGDADRSLFCDAEGAIVDGDATLLVLSDRLAARGALRDDTVVATVMSNLGLELALRERGRTLLRTSVGDKYVLQELLRTNSDLGGEQSGHIIFPAESLVGDGLRTTLHMLRAISETGSPLRQLAGGFTRLPQILVNIPVCERRDFDEVPRIAAEARRTEAELEGTGRLLLRYSGTELLARVMVEGQDEAQIKRAADRLAGVIKEELGV